MNRTFSDFAATLATIRTDLSDLALDAAKPERSVMMRAAAALAMFESDMLRKAAAPTLPGESITKEIDAIVEEHSYYSNMSAEKAENLIRALCDAVCRNLDAR